MNQFECAFCGLLFKSRNKNRKSCSKECRYALMAQSQTLTLEERFWRGVQKGTDCWVWQGGKDVDGYGRFTNYVIPDAPSVIRCHRFSYELHKGPIPEGMCVCHKCDNPPCVNPDHLFLGTNTDNINDMVKKGRHSRGEKVSSTCKLTASQVLAIRERSKNGERQINLAKEYGVDRNTIYRITTRQFWSHI